MSKKILLAAMGMAGAVAAFGAQADSLQAGDERFKVVAGWFLPAFNTDVRVDNGADPGDEVDLDRDLGVDRDQSGVLLGFEWRIAERHRLGVTYSSFSQSATRTIDREITIGDEVYPVNATIKTSWSLDMIPITYSYSFIKSESNELAGTFGIHWDSISLGLKGSSSLSSDDLNANVSSGADLPLPLIGLRYDHNFSNNWSAGLAGSFFTIEFGESELDARGSLYNFRAYTEYRFMGRYGAGLAVDLFNLNIKASKPRLTGEYNYDYWGPQLYLTARF